MKYRCHKCGALFDKPAVIREIANVMDGYQDIYEHDPHCPECGSFNIDERYECPVCGEYRCETDFMTACDRCMDEAVGITMEAIAEIAEWLDVERDKALELIEEAEFMLGYVKEYSDKLDKAIAEKKEMRKNGKR